MIIESYFAIHRGSNNKIHAFKKNPINVADEDIGAERPAELPDLDQVIFVYCRSGRRSKEASAKLAALGYTNIYEFGGILDWDGEMWHLK